MPDNQPALVQSTPKINYIDHIKVLLTMLVILHHTLVTYGAPGGWYYSEKTTSHGALIPMTIFVAVNQAFFMGFFFFLSAAFIPTSYDKKGPLKFITDRLIRLGLPLIFYSFVLSPFLSYLVYYFAGGHRISYGQYLSGFNGWINLGVLWFVAALLLFTLVYALYRAMGASKLKPIKLPSAGAILLCGFAVGLISFAVRIVFPVGWVLKPVGFQLGHFPQYITMFMLGLVASRSKWIVDARYSTGRQMRGMAIIIVAIGLPLLFVYQATQKFPNEWFSGGTHLAQLGYAVWEQLLGFSMVAAILCIAKHKWNAPSPILSKLGRSTFAVYIFHPLIIILLSMAARTWHADPAIKLLAVAPLAVALSFLLGLLLVRIPLINKVV